FSSRRRHTRSKRDWSSDVALPILVDQGLSFDVVTLLSRRGMLGVLGAGAAGLSLAACSDPASAGTDTGGSTLTEIPDETAGPYPARKSTRLNSSHVSMPYAVFFLK